MEESFHHLCDDAPSVETSECFFVTSTLVVVQYVRCAATEMSESKITMFPTLNYRKVEVVGRPQELLVNATEGTTERRSGGEYGNTTCDGKALAGPCGLLFGVSSVSAPIREFSRLCSLVYILVTSSSERMTQRPQKATQHRFCGNKEGVH